MVVGLQRIYIFVGDFGNFFVTQLVVVAHIESYALLSGEREQRLLEQQFNLFAVGRSLGGEFLIESRRHRVYRTEPSRAAVEPSDALVGSDAVDPRYKRACLVEFVDVAIDVDCGFLHHVLGIVMIHDYTADVPIEGVSIFLEQKSKPLVAGVAALEQSHYIVVVGESHSSLLCLLERGKAKRLNRGYNFFYFSLMKHGCRSSPAPGAKWKPS